ncbi:MAG: lipid-A-disaccharide synthase [Thalassospira sp.]|uniref:lipid-A-disaccharide synthase n=1 Tax=unclassified Thalassospira TaxID=2648997 RepID=UPI000C42BF29|nr:lipid-A-disaccharide synthase [Thalassospira sp. UBA4513]MBE71900.1 lipid-A-disaccharide synthase [Thalassospira sp.]|tara:strand:- start:446 stop:1612 length:1167 start_codon:yes stop_codon:yes gene_type:complete
MADEITPLGPKIMLVAGEASGDQLGGRLMAALKAKQDHIRFIGVGGPRMEREGLKSLFPMNEMSVMGLTEVVPHIPHLLKRISQTADFAKSEKPDVVITIDAPDFSFRVGKKLKGKGIPLVHYVAPSVWAWREGRAKKIAGFLDHLLALLPFEPPYFEKEGLPTTFIGHSAVEERHDGDGERFRTQHGLTPDQKLLAVLPGSRNSEVKRLLPVFRKVIDDVAAKYPDARIVVPTVSKVVDTVTEEMKSWPLDPIIVASDRERHDAFSAADCALAASGTVSLELAIAGVPHVIAYQVNAVTGWIAKRLIKIDTVTIVNLVLGKKLIPEFLQDKCKAKKIIPVLETLMADSPERAAQIDGFEEACTLLGFGDRPPSEKAAEQILKIIAKK